MDYRNRDYYLVTIAYESYDMRLNYYKMAAPSLKMHSPYNHFKNGHMFDRYNDGAKGRYWQMMISCKKENSEALEYELRKASRNDKCISSWSDSYFIKLDKNLLGQ